MIVLASGLEPRTYFSTSTAFHTGNFVKAIEESLKQCDALLVVIGNHWLGKRTKGKSRLHNANDFVRMELASAMSQSKDILPVLVGGAGIPPPDELPDDIRGLTYVNTAPLDYDRDFDRDVEKILVVLQDMAAEVGFNVWHGSSDIGYECRRRNAHNVAVRDTTNNARPPRPVDARKRAPLTRIVGP